MNENIFYDPSEMFSYNRMLNMVVGARGIGKTFAIKEYVINRFKKRGALFVYVRRYKTDLKKLSTFFKDIQVKFPDDKFEVKGRSLFMNGKLCGYAIPLSSWQSEKSNAYPDVETIMFDEFIREKDNSKYLTNEVDAFLNLVDTIVRNRDNLRIICMSNSVSIMNPYFLYFSLIPDIKKRFNKTKDIIIEIPQLIDFKQERMKTRFGQLISGTQYAEMAIENSFTGDSYTFVEKRTKHSEFAFAVTYKGTTFGVYADDAYMYVCHSYDGNSKQHFVILGEDMEVGRTLVHGKNNYYLGKLSSAFQKGWLRFENLTLRTIGYEVLKRL